MLESAAVLQGNPHRQALQHFPGTLLPLGKDPGRYLIHRRLHFRAGDFFVGKGVNGDFPVHQGRRHIVFGAELALEGVIRLRIEHYDGQVGLIHFGVGHILPGKVMLPHQAEQAVQHGVIAAAAGILFDNQGILHPKGLAQVFRHFGQVVDAFAQHRGGKAQGMLKNLLAGGKAALGQLGRHHPIPAGQTGVQRLGHRAEVVDDAAGHGAGNAQGGNDLLLIQAQQLGAGGGGGHPPDNGGAVKAALHLVILGGMLQGQAQLAADHIGFQQVAAGGVKVFAQGQQGRENGDGGMAEPAEVVIIQGVAHRAVSQGRVSHGGLQAGGQHRGLGRAAVVVHILLDDFPHRLGRPGQDDAQQVKAGFVSHPQGLRGNVLVAGVDNPLGNGFRSAHKKPPCG